MKNKMCAALAAMVLATAAFALDFPKYLVVVDTTVWDHTDDLPAELVIPNGVTAIGEKAFEGCKNLTSVAIPASVTSIGSNAFSWCENLKEAKFTGTKAQWQAIKGIDELKITYVQCNDGYLGVKNVPDYLKMNGTVVSGHTDGLPADLVIPEDVTAIGSSAFGGCTSLESVTIPGSVKIIGFNVYNDQGRAFANCTNLKSVKIGDGVTEIRSEAFNGCTSLTDVTIPASVTKIRMNAFFECEKLKEVKYTGTKAQWEKIDKPYYGIGINRFVLHCTDGDIFIQ